MINQHLELINILATARRRMRFMILQSCLAFYIPLGILLSSMTVLVSKFIYLSDIIYYLAAIPIFVGVVAALLKILLYKLTLYDVAYDLDARLNLKERLATALEIVDTEHTGEMERFQVNDASRIASDLNLKEIYPYSPPKLIKLIPIALLLLFGFLLMPRYYQIPPEPTVAEREAMQEAANVLENLNGQGALTESMNKKLKDVITALRNKTTDVKKAQKRLTELYSEIKTQRDELSAPNLPQAMANMDKIISQSKLFPNTAPDAVANELERLAEKLQKDKMPPEVKKELEETLKQLLTQLDGLSTPKELAEQLRSIESQILNPEMLKRIAQNLSELAKRAQSTEQLEQMLARIQANQQKIGLAGLNLERKSDGIAKSDSRAGDEYSVGEAQGTQVKINSSSTNNEGMTLKLTGQESSDDTFSPVYTSERPEEGGKSYTPYQEVYLNAKQAMSEALQKERIPARYRKQVLEYFEAIAPE
ncbi:TPA: hypothetical protein EYP66_12450 [Candidatus Poribacteria bacterium]|nr:hypothetical protein [Candidatus Poribacteria bacterium]